MTIHEKITDEKLQHDIYREAAKISPLSTSKSDKYKSFKGEEILYPNQIEMIEHAKLIYSSLGKALGK